MIRNTDTSKLAALSRKIMVGCDRGVPSNCKYDHTVWGVSRESNALAAVDGRHFIPRNPVPVCMKPNRLHF